ncbi:uncharacterized protein LY89DRAFT_682770 [Mollisia scopiformis]|uniref:RRM domain-containing protein n=1 Tax=Mollisia scopiformis TaxID=149040 RepID=A0A194XJJ9_MOLSC|nr:uncharacterized protein LY89DRAFT_682770 [Mollisia scopiformis]KUJ19942.1 hypothetical protein LY89DRAFT_682770 [Mollisia scopiformis]
MAPTKPALDLNAMISADRQRRKNESLAQEIFGKNRRASAPGAGKIKAKSGPVPSLASRIGVAGITKRSASISARPARAVAKPPAGNVDAEWTHDLYASNNGTPNVPRGPRAQRQNRNDRLHFALNGSASSPALNSQFNIVGNAKPTTGISIKGLALGPYMVVAKNLAPGTTAADIESAMIPIGGVVLSCRIIAERPKVIAELAFETKEGADNVVDTLNNQNADGNILHVYHKVGPLPATVKKQLSANPAPISPAPRVATPLGPRADRLDADRSDDNRSYGGSDRYTPRDRSRERERRRDYDRDDVIDGSYGFADSRMDTDNDNRNDRGRGQGLYSDSMINNRGRGRGNSWDRGRNNNDRRSYR